MSESLKIKQAGPVRREITLEEVRKNLARAMETIKVDKAVESILNNLMYAAYETGILPFKMHGNFCEIIQLVRLAEQLKNNE